MEPQPKDWGKHTEALETFASPPTGDCFCKETVFVREWFANVESKLQTHITPVGCTTAHGWYLMDHYIVSRGTYSHSILYENKIECKTEAEWKNYWDQQWIYDNQWFLCNYYIPYPFPEGDSHSNYNGPNNCLRE